MLPLEPELSNVITKGARLNRAFYSEYKFYLEMSLLACEPRGWLGPDSMLTDICLLCYDTVNMAHVDVLMRWQRLHTTTAGISMMAGKLVGWWYYMANINQFIPMKRLRVASLIHQIFLVKILVSLATMMFLMWSTLWLTLAWCCSTRASPAMTLFIHNTVITVIIITWQNGKDLNGDLICKDCSLIKINFHINQLCSAC